MSSLRAGFPDTAVGVSSSVHHRLLSSAAEGSQIVSANELTRLNSEALQAMDDLGINFFNEI